MPGSPLPQASCNIKLPLKLALSEPQRTLGGWPFWDLFSKDMSKGGDKSKSQAYLYTRKYMALISMSCPHNLFSLSSEGQTESDWLFF